MSPEVLTYLQRNNKNQITVTFSEGNITKWPNRRPAIIYGKPKTTYDYQLFEKENIEVFVGKDIAAAYSTLTLDFFNIFFSEEISASIH